MRRSLCICWLALLVLSAAPVRSGETSDRKAEGQRIIRDAQALVEGCAVRFQGSPGNRAMSDKIERIFKESGLPCGVTRYEAPAFIPGKAMIKVGGRKFQLHTLLPNLVDPCNPRAKHFSGRLHYVHKGGLEALNGRDIKGSLCLFDFSCGYSYLDVMPLGAVGCIFIEPEHYWPSLAYEKVLSLPMSVPRYQVSREDGLHLKKLASALGGVEFEAEIEPNRWERQEFKNHWVLIEGADPEAKRELVILHTNLDSMHYCPELPSGGHEAMNLELLLKLFAKYKQKPAGRSLLFQVHNSAHQLHTGASEATYHIFGPEEDILNVDKSRASEERSDWRTKVEAEYLLQHYPRLAPDLICPDAIVDFRDRQDKPAGHVYPLADPFIRHIEVYVHRLGQERTRLFRRGELTDELAEKINKDRREKGDLVSLFNKFGRVKQYDYALLAGEKAGSDLRDWPGFAVELQKAGAAAADTPAKRIWDRLPASARDLITRVVSQKEPAPEDYGLQLSVAVNHALRAKDLYSDAAWQGRTLSPRGQELLQQLKAGSLAARDITHLNRRLLEAAYPDRIDSIEDIERRMARAHETREDVELTPRQRELFEAYRQRVMQDAQASKKRAELYLSWLREVKRVRQVLKPYHPLLALGVSLTYDNLWLSVTKGGVRAGSDFADAASSIENVKSKYGLSFTNRLATLAEGIQRETGVRWASGKADQYLYKDMPPLASAQYIMQAVPSFAFLTPYGGDGALLSSRDRLEALDPEVVSRKRAFLFRMIEEVLQDAKTSTLAKVASDGELKSEIPWRSAGSVEIETRIQDGSSLNRPQTILRDGLVVWPLARAKWKHKRAMIAASAVKGGVLGYRLALSDTDGRAMFYNGGRGASYKLEVYHLDADGRIDYATDKGLMKQKYETVWKPAVLFKEHHLLACAKVRKADLYDLYHPKTLNPVGKPLFQREAGGQVERHSEIGFETLQVGFGPIFLPDEIRARVLFTGNVNLLNNTKKKYEGKGYLHDELDRKSTPYLATRDALNLNAARIALLNANAVTNKLMDSLHKKSQNWLFGGKKGEGESLERLRQQEKHLDVFRRVMKSYGATFSAYPVVNATISDMMKAVIFYLAVLIPFAFFLQRLVFSFVRVEAQIASFVVVFLVTYIVFHHVHPAFRVAKNPQIVLIAFTMLTLAGFVAFALKGKFDYHMESFKARFQSEEDVGVLKLAGTAMLIGVTNMKRRRLRTTLTCFTIVLITFTMLSFTSVSQSVSPTRIRKGDDVPYNGIFYSRQTWKELDRRTVDILTEVLGAGRDTLQRGFAAYDKAEETAVLLTAEQDRDIPVRGILALQTKEDGWLSKMPIVAGRFFSDDEAMEVVVTDAFARDTLGLTMAGSEKRVPENMWVTVNGVRLKLVGLLDSEKMANIRDLRGAAIVPQILSGKTSFDVRNEATLEEEEVPEGTFQDVNPRFYVVVPFGIRDMLGVPVVSVSIKMNSAQEVWDRTLDFAHYSDNKVYLGAKDRFVINSDRGENEDPIYEMAGRYYLGTGFATSFGGLSSLIIPLLVSATIIFNTMLGAVYERKKEIGIFNSIGLNPIHIALFFVAEAVVYGILGGVGGYLIGQVLAQVIVHFNLLSDINLNYSSVTVVYVILFTMVIVIISTIYPALVAMRTASSSSGRRRIEKEGENRLQVQFPYSFTREMAIAVNSYLKEYFDKHSDSSVGEFVAVPLECKHEGTDEDLRMRLQYDVALAPYDLGVTQIVTVETRLNKEVGAFMVEAQSDRKSGQEANWMATNQPFLNGIRKYLLHWRVLSREGQEAHMEEGLRLFELDLGGGETRQQDDSSALPSEG